MFQRFGAVRPLVAFASFGGNSSMEIPIIVKEGIILLKNVQDVVDNF